MPAEPWRQVHPCLARLGHNSIQAPPHCLICETIAALRQKQGHIRLRARERWADLLLKHAHCGLCEWGKDRLAYPLSRALCALPVARLNTALVVEQVTVRAKRIEVAELLGPPPTL